MPGTCPPRFTGRSTIFTTNAVRSGPPTASAGHHAWSEEPWTRRFHLSLRGGAPYHPNATGMAAIADLAAAILTGEG